MPLATVRVADSIDSFVRQAQDALAPDPDRMAEGIALARESSWESIVDSMDRLVARAARARRAPHVDFAARSIRDHATATQNGNGKAAAAASETAAPRSVSVGGSSTLAKRSNTRGERAADSR